VAYIISDAERSAFKNLPSNPEKEHFIEQFWQRRDPTPGTVENEMKEEHYRRIAYANQNFAAGIAGWKTDRGRIYIVYGPPDQKESHPSGGTYRRPASEGGGTITAVPFEQWMYRYIDGVGDNVIVEFIDPNRSGEFRQTMDPNEKDAMLMRPPPEPSANVPKFYVQGEVGHPGAFPLTMPIRVLQALVNAGGFKDAANRIQITIRHIGGEAETFNYQDVIAGRNTEQNILLKPGDIIIVNPLPPGKAPLGSVPTPKAAATVQRAAAGMSLISVPLVDFGAHKVVVSLRVATPQGRTVHTKEITIQGPAPFVSAIIPLARGIYQMEVKVQDLNTGKTLADSVAFEMTST